MPLTLTQIADALGAHPYFAVLDVASLRALARRTVARTFERGETILLEGEPAGPFYLVVRGRVRVYKSSADGRELVLVVAGPNSALNEVPALDGGTNPASVESLTRAELLAVPPGDFRRVVREHQAATMAVLASFAARLRQLTGMAEDLALRSVTERLAKLLLQQAELVGEMTQGEMAAAIGTVREVAARSLRALADEGLIRVERHRILIVDRQRLSRFARL